MHKQALVPGVVSNPEESAFTLVMIVITIFSLWGVDTYNMQVSTPGYRALTYESREIRAVYLKWGRISQ